MAEKNKITELIKYKGKLSYSFEVTPDIKEQEIEDLQEDPLFFSVTWHAKSHQCKDLNIGPLRLANFLAGKKKHVLMHLTCDLLKEKYLIQLLAKLQEMGVCNLFLVLGEAYEQSTSDFKNTTELIKFIRRTTGEYFCIGVAGFPDCSEEKLITLKEKIDSGADFIITQAFFDSKLYKTFRQRCKEKGVRVPIIPGLFPFNSYKQFHGFINLCKIKISNDLLKQIEANEMSGESCGKLIKNLICEVSLGCEMTHFHFFTLNKLQICLDIIKEMI